METQIISQPRKKSRGPTSRNWCFTRNNYNDTDINYLQTLTYKYLIYGKEIAPETGTPHLQGFVIFPSSRYRPANSLFHWEIARGTPDQNRTYCSKEGNFEEFGVCPKPSLSWAEYVDKIKKDEMVYEERFTAMYPNYSALLLANLRPKTIYDGELTQKNTWIVGPPGSGKTRSVYQMAAEQNKKVYRKNLNKWWCDYRQETIVLIDDIHPDHAYLLDYIKMWSDRYPFTAELKGRSMQISPHFSLVVTSNYFPEEVFASKMARDSEAVLRRFLVRHQ